MLLKSPILLAVPPILLAVVLVGLGLRPKPEPMREPSPISQAANSREAAEMAAGMEWLSRHHDPRVYKSWECLDCYRGPVKLLPVPKGPTTHKLPPEVL